MSPAGTVGAGLLPAYVKAAVCLAFTLLSLLCFAQCVRLAVHLVRAGSSCSECGCQ